MSIAVIDAQRLQRPTSSRGRASKRQRIGPSPIDAATISDGDRGTTVRVRLSPTSYHGGDASHEYNELPIDIIHRAHIDPTEGVSHMRSI